MKKWRKSVRVIAIFLALLLVVPCNMVFAADAKATAKIKHDAPKDYVPGFRITLDANIKDKADVLVARCYHKTKKENNFIFVDMVPKSPPDYLATLPAPWIGSEYIDYVFVVVNKKKQVARTQMFRMEERETIAATKWKDVTQIKEIPVDKTQELIEQYKVIKKEIDREYGKKLPKHQTAASKGKLQLLTEFENPAAQIKGFYDNLAIITVPTAQTYGGLVTGLYTETEVTTLGGTHAVSDATGASFAGTVTATGAVGVGTIAIGALAVGTAAAVGGGSSGGSPAPSGGGSTPPPTPPPPPGGGVQLFPLVTPPNGSAIPCCDLELTPLSGPPVPMTITHPGLNTTWPGTFPMGYASVGPGQGRMTLTSDVSGGRFDIHFPTGGGRVQLTVNGNAGDYILFQTQ